MFSRTATVALAVFLIPAATLHANVTLQFDTSLDTNGFFAPGSNALATLEAAGDFFSGILQDDLLAIVPKARNSWEAIVSHPSTGEEYRIPNLVVPADTIIIYVGSRDIDGNTLAYGGPGGYSASGFASWFEIVERRGEGPTKGTDAVDFAPWGGMVSVDAGSVWHDDYLTLPSSGKNDLYSTLLHEIGHVLGFGLADSWTRFVSGTRFTGPEAVAVHGSEPSVTSTGTHWANSTQSYVFPTGAKQEAAMDPDLAQGRRKVFTYLDVAALADIGWQISVGPFLPGDLNGDGYVGSADLDLVRSRWGAAVSPGPANGDPSGDGVVGSADLDLVRANWGAGVPPAAAVPEPATGLILLALSGFLAVRPRRSPR